MTRVDTDKTPSCLIKIIPFVDTCMQKLSRLSRFHELLPTLSSNVIIFKPQHRVLSLKHSCRLTPILAMGKRSHLNGGYLLFLIYYILHDILYRPLLFITPRANILQECLKLSWHQQCTISNTSPQRAKLLLILCFIQFTITRSRTSTYVSDIVEIELFWNSDESWKTAQTLPQGNTTPFICKFFT